MPDWFYRTVSRPLLFRLPARTAHGLTLRFMGGLARLPLGVGGAVIDFLGHMAPPAPLRQSLLGINFPTRVGLSSWLDTEAVALPALARFGFGFLEIGPVSVEPSSENRLVGRRANERAIWHSGVSHSLGLKVLAPRIAEASRLGLPVIAQLQASPHASCEKAVEEFQCLIRELAPAVSLFSVPIQVSPDETWSAEMWRSHCQKVVAAAQSVAPPRPILLRLFVDAEVDVDNPVGERIEIALQEGVSGLQLSGSICSEGGQLIGAPVRVLALEQVRRLRAAWPHTFILGAGGVHQPQDALDLYQAGADLVQLDSGLVFSGPGLPKRINEALLCELLGQNPVTPKTVAAVFSESEEAERPASMTWFWTLLMGMGMLFGSFLTLVIAATRVVLPYDESFLGMSRDQLASLNARVLPFMMHDRVTLAGTMVALGVLYASLSFFGVRRGMHWAQKTVFVSAFTGFGSFFFFLGFGYLDPLHAFVTSCLLQFLLLGVHSKLGAPQPHSIACLRNDRAWHWSLWGQLLMIAHGAALLVAGLAISLIGVTDVFTTHDLEFIQASAEVLKAANPRLVPLIAHDRATLGGMLLCSGWAFLLPSLWGYRRGCAWLWWTFLAAGLCAYGAAIGVHLLVGYTDFAHLLPAAAGLGLLLLALGLSFPYLCGQQNDD